MSPVTAARISRFGMAAFVVVFPSMFVTAAILTRMGSTTPRKRAKSKRAYQLMEERRLTSRAMDL